MEYIGAFLIGFLGSLHCLGMCGPIAFALPVNRQSKWTELNGSMVYIFGKLCAYAVLGFIFGLMGKVLVMMKLQQYLSIVVGLILIFSVIPLFRGLFKSNITLYNRFLQPIKERISNQFKKRSLSSLYSIGFLNGLLPCGLVYVGVAAAVALGDPLKSALFMALFGLGTSPLLVTVVLSKSLLKKETFKSVKKALPVLVVFMGLLFIVRGLNLGVPYLSPKVYHQSDSIECHTPD